MEPGPPTLGVLATGPPEKSHLARSLPTVSWLQLHEYTFLQDPFSSYSAILAHAFTLCPWPGGVVLPPCTGHHLPLGLSYPASTPGSMFPFPGTRAGYMLSRPSSLLSISTLDTPSFHTLPHSTGTACGRGRGHRC